MSRKQTIRRDFELMKQAAAMVGRLVEQRGLLPDTLRRDAHALTGQLTQRSIEGLRGNPEPEEPDPGEVWKPEPFGGSLAIAGAYGQLASFHLRADHVSDSAALFARWAAREALAYIEQWERKHGDTFLLFEEELESSQK